MTQATQSKRLSLALLYRLVVGVFCTGLLAIGFIEPSVFGWSYGTNWLAFSLYILLATLARFFSFEAPERRITLTLDTPIYLASVVSLGEVMGGLACYTSLMFFLLSQTIYQRVISKAQKEPVIENIARVLFAPAMGTAVLLGLVAILDQTPSPENHPGLYRFVLLLGILFVVVQYSLTAVYYVLRGVTWERFFKGVLLPGLVTEMALIPIAILMVLVYNDSDLSPFILLSVIFLFVNYVLRNLSQTSAKLSRQVRELAALNRLGQTICATLERPQLVARIAQETLDLFASADSFCLHWTDETDENHLDVYDRKGVAPKKFPHTVAREVAESALKSDKPLQRTTPEGAWLAVSVTVSDVRVGSLALWSRSGQPFHADDVGFLTVVAQQAAIALENARLYELATVDSLTGLYVRRYFDDRLRDEVARIKRYGGRCSLALIDVDYLKTINDTHGHQAGDAALEHVAHVMRQGTRMVDIPARIGGDEFAVLLPNLDITTAQLVADRLRRQVAKVPVVMEKDQFKVTVSLGVVSFPHPDIDSVEDLIAAADQALYQAKCSPGRNRVETNDPALKTPISDAALASYDEETQD